MRPEKSSIVSELSEALKRSPFVLVTDYRGMKVADFSELRNRLSPAGAEVHVVKNSFLKLAMTDSGFPQVADQFAGQTAVVTGEADVAPVAKIFKTFATEFKLAALRVGFVDRAVLSPEELKTLAELPRNFAGAIAGTAVIPGNTLGASVQRTGCGVSAAVERESRKGGRARGMNFVRQAIVCRTNPTQTKLSELVATGFNSSKAFGGGNWRKNKNGRYR
jgi:large subunit ribosomal protein L10